jgi:diguanylate cyclase (GGDEF)-like protein
MMARVPDVGGRTPTAEEVRFAQAAELRSATRTTALAGGVLILVGLPVWGLYDVWVEPEHAGTFLAIRFGFLIPIALAWLALWWPRFGERHAEALALLVCGLPQVAIAIVLPQVEHAFHGYLMGFSLVIYGCAFILVARLRLTLALIAITWVSVLVSALVQNESLNGVEVATLLFYLGTATVMALVGRYYRIYLERRALSARMALEREQERTLALVDQLNRMSREDFLTGVANRRAWDEGLTRACAEAERSGRPLSVLLLDIDQFKAINDRFGHRAGDEVLKRVGATVAHRIRTSDLLARVGGDEFAVLCPDTIANDAGALGHDLIAMIDALPDDLPVAVSVGVAVWVSGDDADSLLGRADLRLYEAKAAAGSAVVMPELV